MSTRETPRYGQAAPPIEQERLAEVEWGKMLAGGPARREAWVRDGLLVSREQVAAAWHTTPSRLAELVAPATLNEIHITGAHWLPVCYLDVTSEAAAAVNSSLIAEEDPVAASIFWTRAHGVLGARTIPRALAEGELLARVVELAHGWAEERGCVV